MSTPLSGIEATLGKDLLNKIQSSKILLVGSGGIGCELLKNLALSGFRHVEVIDLDTIDVSNLNRQFLFRSQHVGKPKCDVACEVSQRMIPVDRDSAKYLPHHGNVCDNSKFNVPYVKQFNLVLNALDNVTARRRVNRLCLAASVPLIEAGTTGYLGQVKVCDKASGLACYECVTQETQKVYPICTIRSTPSQPVHCIVWAKELYKLLFGKAEESMLDESGGKSESEEQAKTPDDEPLDSEPSIYMESVLAYRELLSSPSKEEKLAEAARLILETLFCSEIEKQLAMDRYKTAKKTPSVLSKELIKTKVTAPTQRESYKTTDVWSQEDCVAEFVACLIDAASINPLLPSFDKDDRFAMRLVTAAANLRSSIFSITPLQSEYSAKGIAGNIIPAIATTNAIVAGLQVLQAFAILKAQLEGKPDSLKECCRYVDVVRNRSGRSGWYLMSSTLPSPNPNCFVCRNATIPLTLNVKKWTLEALLTRIVKAQLGFQEPTLMLGSEGNTIWEEGQDADTDLFQQNLPKILNKLPCGGIHNGSVLKVEDFSQDLEVDICFSHQENWKVEEGEDGTEQKYLIGGEKPVAKIAPVAKLPQGEQANGSNADDDILEVIDASVEDQKQPGSMEEKKRKALDTLNGDTVVKRPKVEVAADIIVID
mmetsp:Transcript_22967/g.33900  ORF Transcript_22967/g.33900 Transcript_22967/m.33900 type:complete len:653 (+) Transcript_22967:94-2052(+)|eukprot:CAMPEP_0194204410 /NCGR_PEP_ID=MMETSP0156-20130528/3932_1 /TAXON_ID=33649 /ORGANISM="Thalassionema nitzschioides, Strain L26-B" /LENGTH=652 /DNA_ID=CAMNT_0038930409 /DNA_START=91 /DNA_END=2049 /DNA_ORIENTATION=-